MDISKKLLITTAIINFVLIAICVVCMFVTKFSNTVLWLNACMIVLVLVSSVLTWHFGKQFKK